MDQRLRPPPLLQITRTPYHQDRCLFLWTFFPAVPAAGTREGKRHRTTPADNKFFQPPFCLYLTDPSNRLAMIFAVGEICVPPYYLFLPSGIKNPCASKPIARCNGSW